MQSRKYEIQQKKLAVRRLSHGGKRGPFSPTGEGTFPFKRRESPEEIQHHQGGTHYRSRSYNQRGRGYQHYQSGRGQTPRKPHCRSRTYDNTLSKKPETNRDAHKAAEPKPLLSTNNPFLPASMKQTSIITKDDPSTENKQNPFVWTANKLQSNSAAIDTKTSRQENITSASGGSVSQKSSNPFIPSFGNNAFGGLDRSNPFQVALEKAKQQSNTMGVTPSSSTTISVSESEQIAGAMFQSGQPERVQLQEQITKPAIVFGSGAIFTKSIMGITGNSLQQKDAPIKHKENIFTKALEEAQDCTVIKATQIPESFLHKTTLLNHFSSFGPVKRVKVHSRSKSAVVTFADHESASKAKDHGTVVQEGLEPLNIFWYQKPPKLSSDMKENKSSEKTKVKGHRKKLDTIRNSVLQFVDSISSQKFADASAKAELLGKIDKIIRDGLDKETDLKKATALKGTCQDMCPEKERYLREFQRRLSSFEILAGTEHADTKQGEYPMVDHRRVIKEYSRSSADQEEPLSHELRPPDVLCRTMDFLVANAMDPGEGKWADWYDFIWNRTRGIRKDITQQHLCDETSVSLIEKCARFHIFCSHHFCEESMDCFDPKMNNDNLETQCLPSLKQMYEDLAQKGIVCPNESEFRCYQVLLNLNHGDILREVMELKPEIRESREVKFALQVFSAVNNSNYVRFFKLLRCASYLNACIMHRYFDQMRSKALQIMSRAYVLSQPVTFPIEDIMQIMAFDELERAVDYCDHYGLEVTSSAVYLSRTSYVEPSEKYKTWRSRWIDEKRVVSYGEVVNGSPLPSMPDYRPTVSFDETGLYNGTYHKIALMDIYSEETDQEEETDGESELRTNDSGQVALDSGQVALPAVESTTTLQNAATAVVIATSMSHPPEAQAIPAPVSQVVPSSVPQPIQINKEDIKECCKELIYNVLNQEVANIAADVHREELETTVAVNQIAEHSIAKVVIMEMKEIVAQAILVEKKRRADERNRLIASLTCELLEDILRREVGKEVRTLVEETIRQESLKLMERIRSREISNRCAEMISDTVQREVKDVVVETMNEEIKKKKEILIGIRNKILKKRTRKCFLRWKHYFKKQKDLKELLFEFPSMRPLKTSRSTVQGLLTKKYGSGVQNLFGEGDHLLPSIQRRRQKHMDAIAKYHQHLKEERDLMAKSVNMEDILKEYLNKRESLRPRSETDSIFLKIAVSLSDQLDDKDSTKHKTLSSMSILHKLTSASESPDSAESAEGVKHCWLSAYQINACYVYLSIKGFQGTFSKKTEQLIEKRELYGTSGILFLLDNVSDDEVYWREQISRLHNIILSKPSVPQLPLVVMAISSTDEITKTQITSSLQLNNLKAEGLVNEFNCILFSGKESAFEIDSQLTSALLWLMENTDTTQSLKSSSLESYIDGGLSHFFFSRVYEDLRQRNAAGLKPQNPNVFVELYNSIIGHLAEVCSDDSYCSLSWPAPEFADVLNIDPAWNSPQGLKRVKNMITCLYLPEKLTLTGNESVTDQNERCWKYVMLNLENPLNKGYECVLLNRIGQTLESWSRKRLDPKSHWNVIFPWLSVVEEIIGFTLSNRQLNKHCKHDILYSEKKFAQFSSPPSWAKHCKESRSYRYRNTISKSVQETRNGKIKELIDQTNLELDGLQEKRLKRINSATDIETTDRKKELLAASTGVSKLQSILLQERVAFSRFQETLSSSLLHQDGGNNTTYKRKRKDDTSVSDEDVSPSKRFQNVGQRKRRSDLDILEKELQRFVDDLETTRADLEHESSQLENIIAFM